MEIKQISKEFGDCTAFYEVTTKEVFLVKFIENEVLKCQGDWGLVFISGRDICVCEYRYGKIVRRSENYDSYGIAKIKSIKGSGGWSRFDYEIEIDESDPISANIPPQSKEDYDFVHWGKPLDTVFRTMTHKTI